MPDLKISVSGIRGIWGNGFDLKALHEFTSGYAIFIKKNGHARVLIGRDARPSGKEISVHVSNILKSFGIDVADCGIIPTPTVLFGVKKLGFDGGIIISASHNPIEWNALKLVGRDGCFIREEDIKKIRSCGGLKGKFTPANRKGINIESPEIGKMHIKAILDKVSLAKIMEKCFRIVFDPVNSAGSIIGSELLKNLGCEVKLVNGEMNGTFGRGSEPIPGNLAHMTGIVRDFHADAGFALDPDADRLVITDENGRILSEELTLALAVEHVLSRSPGAKAIVINLSTSMVNECIAGKYRVKCYRTKVGEANVSAGIIKYNAVIGGEGNGGVIYPEINLARDSLAGMALILEMMAERRQVLSEIAGSFPAYFMTKEKLECRKDIKIIFNKIKIDCPGATVNEEDGLRLEWKENNKKIWIHIRSSNTEPVIRVIGESESDELLKKSLARVRNIIG